MENINIPMAIGVFKNAKKKIHAPKTNKIICRLPMFAIFKRKNRMETIRKTTRYVVACPFWEWILDKNTAFLQVMPA